MMRKIFILIVGLLSVAYILFSLAELDSIRAALNQSNPIFLLLAVAVEALVLAIQAVLFSSLYHLVGLSESRLRMFLMVIAASFVNIIAPAAGIAGMAVFIDQAHRRGQPTARAAIVGILYLLYEYASLFVALLVGFLVLMKVNQLNAGEITAAGFLLLLAGSIAAMVIIGYRSSKRLGQLLAWLARLLNRVVRPFIHRDYLDIQKAYEFADEIAEGISTLKGKRGEIFRPLLFTLANKALLILILGICLVAMGYPFEIQIVVAGFSIAQLFFYASPTPSGVGFVDSIMPVALSSLGIQFSGAVLITLIYRAVTFWIPLGLGAIAFRYLQHSLSAEAPTGD